MGSLKLADGELVYEPLTGRLLGCNVPCNASMFVIVNNRTLYFGNEYVSGLPAGTWPCATGQSGCHLWDMSSCSLQEAIDGPHPYGELFGTFGNETTGRGYASTVQTYTSIGRKASAPCILRVITDHYLREWDEPHGVYIDRTPFQTECSIQLYRGMVKKVVVTRFEDQSSSWWSVNGNTSSQAILSGVDDPIEIEINSSYLWWTVYAANTPTSDTGVVFEFDLYWMST